MRNALLLFMVVCYLTPIYYVYSNYNGNKCISNIICDVNCKHIILFFMFLMGVGTVLYELERNDTFSTICICIILVGIFGLISVDETQTIHYVFASFVFIAIILFMMRHCLTDDPILLSSLGLEIITLLYMCIHEDIFIAEIVYVINFACFYLYLHQADADSWYATDSLLNN